LSDLVDQIFPPVTTKIETEFNDWNYWKPPLPEVQLPTADSNYSGRSRLSMFRSLVGIRRRGTHARISSSKTEIQTTTITHTTSSLRQTSSYTTLTSQYRHQEEETVIESNEHTNDTANEDSTIASQLDNDTLVVSNEEEDDEETTSPKIDDLIPDNIDLSSVPY
jgi:phosphatidate phosphatase LPIN